MRVGRSLFFVTRDGVFEQPENGPVRKISQEIVPDTKWVSYGGLASK